MTEAYTVYLAIGQTCEGAEQSQLFGKPCFKINGKAFISFFEEEVVFKLTGAVHSEAMSLDGSRPFDPSGKNRPMKEWVQVPFHYREQWKQFAQEALHYVSSTTSR